MNKRRQYSEESLLKAVEAVQKKTYSAREAAKVFNVPRSSIQAKIKNPVTKFRSGPNPILSEQEEKSIVDWIIQLAKRGFPRKREDIKVCVQDFLNQNPRPNPFPNNIPGNGWFNMFLKRNPIVVERSSEGVTNASACVSEKDIRKWFEEINHYFITELLLDVIKDPSRVFNADETNFNMCPRTGKVLAFKGQKNVYEIEKASSKENMSVMFTFAVNGFSCKLMTIFAYQRLPEKLLETITSGWGVSKSDKGWMTSSVFYEYISNVFFVQLCEASVKFPVILFVDGHKTHITIEVTELCKKLNIHLVALYPNATRILQPADVAAFRPIKQAWSSELRDWYMANDYTQPLNKLSFAPLLQKAIDKSIKESTLKNGFKVSGLCPFDPNQVDYSKCLSQMRNENSTPPENNQPLTYSRKTMSYEMFSQTVGEEILQRCNKIMPSQLENYEFSAEFKAIYKMWAIFQTLDDTHLNHQLELSPGFEIEGFSDTEMAINSTPIVETQDDGPEIILDATTGIFVRKLHMDPVTEPTNEHSTTLSEVHPCPSEPYHHAISESKKKSVISDVYLKARMWPSSPKRKGKRNIERMPFAMTSDAYINLLKEKINKKELVEKEKEDRKLKRIEKRRIKQQEDMKPKKKVKVAVIIEDPVNPDSIEAAPSTSGLNLFSVSEENHINEPIPSTSGLSKIRNKKKYCEACKRNNKNLLLCSSCEKMFHKTCVPNFHQIHIPAEEDDLFLCHICYHEDDSDDSIDAIYNLI